MLNRLVLVFWPRVDLVQSYNLTHPPFPVCSAAVALRTVIAAVFGGWRQMTIGTSASQRTVTLYG